MTKTLVQTRNLFIDTEETLIGECRDVTINLPQDVMSCNQNQEIRVTLQAFNMRKSWYSVNQYNVTFFVLGANSAGNLGKFGRVKIPNGNYQSFTDSKHGLALAIKTSLEVVLKDPDIFNITTPSTNVSWNNVTNKFSIVFNTSGGTDVLNMKFVTFTINNFESGNSLVQQIIGVNTISAFQDNYELMGGCNEQRNIVSSYADLQKMFTTDLSGSTYTMTGEYIASLATEEAIYVRTDLNSTSYQTAGFDTGSLFPYVVNSQILAKIPITQASFAFQSSSNNDNDTLEEYQFEANCPIIQFTDNGNNLYSVMLKNKQVSSVRLYITDSYGRLIPEISKKQIKCSALHFTCCLRVDIFNVV